MRFAAVVLAALMLTAAPVGADVNRGLEAYEAGDYVAAFEDWAAEAQDGDPTAQFLLAHLYEGGLGVEADPVEAYLWYNLAAGQGYEDAEIGRDRVADSLTDAQLAAVREETESLDGETEAVLVEAEEVVLAADGPEAEADTEATDAKATDAEATDSLSPEEALLDAVLRDDVGQAAGLLAVGGDPDLRFSDGDPILLEAARQGYVSLVLTLIGAGATLDATGDAGWTPLMVAIEGGHENLAAILLRQGADPFAIAADGTTAADLAAEREQTALLDLIGEAPGAVETAVAEPLPAPTVDELIAAAEAGDGAAIVALLDAGADANGRDSDGWTPLMFAAFSGDRPSAQALIAAGAKVNAKADDGSTALMAATLGSRAGMVRLLLKAGAKAGRRTSSGATALQIAEQKGLVEIADLLRPHVGPAPELVAEVQSLLTRLGHAPGPVDGAMGPKTRNAVKAFQTAHSLTANGRVTTDLLAALQAADARRSGDNAAKVAWAALERSRNPADYLAFAAEFPNSPLATEAQNRANLLAVEVLRRKTAEAAAQVAPRVQAQGQIQAQGQVQAQGQPVASQATQSRRAAYLAAGQQGGQPRPQPVAAPGQPSAQERADWATVMGRGRAQDFAAYLEAYPNGTFAQQAQYLMQQQALQGGQAQAPAPVDLTPVAQYLKQRPQHFHGAVNAYNKKNKVIASATRTTFKVREIYESIPVGAENGTYAVNVLMGVGNWQDSANNAGLNIDRVILFLAPAGDRFRIVGHTTDVGGLTG